MGTTRLPLLLTCWINNKGRWVVPNLVYIAGFNSTAHKNFHLKRYTHNNLILEQELKEIFQFFLDFQSEITAKNASMLKRNYFYLT